MTQKDFEFNFHLESDQPIPTDIEAMAEDVVAITSVAIIAREHLHTAEDVNAVLKAIFLYTDAKDYERHLVAQIVGQYIDSLPSEEEENGD
jgi:hypothetical protein